MSQNEILAIPEVETGSKFAITEEDINKAKEEADRGLAAGEWNRKNIYTVVKGATVGSNSSANWGEADDTESLGVPKKDLKTEIKKFL